MFQERWLLFKSYFLQAEECCILMDKKLSKRDRTPAGMNKKLLLILRHKQEIHKVEAGVNIGMLLQYAEMQ